MHQCTMQLVRDHALIAIEDLAVTSMTASTTGSVEAHGRNVNFKPGLNWSIL